MIFERAPRAASRGFTLLEVMVALLIVALGIVGLFNQIISISAGTIRMKERTLASWVALNEITRVRVSGELPDVGEFDGDVEFASAEYRWQARVSETGVDNLRRIDIDVSYLDDPDNVIGRGTGFLTLPAPPGAQSGWGGAGFVDGEAGGAPRGAENNDGQTSGEGSQ
ncbi:MAG: type II secretion system minor pseudopilin GspI [Gammaproteobacteria bacterium]